MIADIDDPPGMPPRAPVRSGAAPAGLLLREWLEEPVFASVWMRRMNRTALATVTGLGKGLALVFGNFGDMLIVALFGAIGYGAAEDPQR